MNSKPSLRLTKGCSIQRGGGWVEVTRWAPSVQRGSCNPSRPVNKSAGLPSAAERERYAQATQVTGVHGRDVISVGSAH